MIKNISRVVEVASILMVIQLYGCVLYTKGQTIQSQWFIYAGFTEANLIKYHIYHNDNGIYVSIALALLNLPRHLNNFPE